MSRRTRSIETGDGEKRQDGRDVRIQKEPSALLTALSILFILSDLLAPAACNYGGSSELEYMANVCETILPLRTRNVSVPSGTSRPTLQVI